MTHHILSLDQGTTSTRAILFDAQLSPVATAQQEFDQHFPQSGWVEHDAQDLIDTSLAVMKDVIEQTQITPDAIGITNQRETTILWNTETGKPLDRAIVWQDRRTAQLCAELKQDGFETEITARTGLLLDPYFSGTKLKFLLDKHPNARDLARAGKVKFGTVDSWLIWNLTEGRVHATDATNAARTMLYNIHEGAWDSVICDKLDIPMELLPQVRDCADTYGETTLLGGSIPIRGVAGDQQAATVGQACFKQGMMKSTYGTGCFAVLNTGDTAVTSRNRMLTTIAYQLDGKPTYALEGAIFIAGAVVQWLRDGLGIIEQASDTLELAQQADETQSIYLVPAFTGLGAPHWDADARGAIFGLTRNTGPAEFAKAALESVGYQTRDLIEAMQDDWKASGADDPDTSLRVDGGMSANGFAMQFLSDILDAPVDQPKHLETTALGAAYLAGLSMGLQPAPHEFAKQWKADKQFTPNMDAATRTKKYAGWTTAIGRTLTKD
ncbi:glycerol kinase [Pacificibacter maritimus]|uniref:Glycerol kinase n=1 Tax=Pacificibacter maritimus TaxID=762213 RepID=A0A3N4USP1_9RHOB|nr:glycerol kinase GlpK [Pacificibacter maritimus]RPE71725.1 glycerol kinase [Pacificibacter maritimus]